MTPSSHIRIHGNHIFLLVYLRGVLMLLIREIVQQALASGCLTVAAEEQLRQLLAKKYEAQDLQAFMKLQQATMSGLVKQESRELLYSS